MNITPIRSTAKPRARPGVMGFVCYGFGVEGHGMTLDAAYASWEHRFMQRRGVALPDYQARNDETVLRLEAQLA